MVDKKGLLTVIPRNGYILEIYPKQYIRLIQLQRIRYWFGAKMSVLRNNYVMSPKWLVFAKTISEMELIRPEIKNLVPLKVI